MTSYDDGLIKENIMDAFANISEERSLVRTHNIIVRIQKLYINAKRTWAVFFVTYSVESNTKHSDISIDSEFYTVNVCSFAKPILTISGEPRTTISPVRSRTRVSQKILYFGIIFGTKV